MRLWVALLQVLVVVREPVFGVARNWLLMAVGLGCLASFCGGVALFGFDGMPQPACFYAKEEHIPDLVFYHPHARCLNTGTGRFWTRDKWEGVQTDPLSLHKYLYAANNPVNLSDPSGHDFIQTLGSMYVWAQMAAWNFMVTAGSYGAAETTLALMVLGYAESMSAADYVTAAVMLGVDAFSMGQGGRILRFPGWAKLHQLKDWTKRLHAEHVADAPASRKAMAAALQFSEEIVPGSLQVGGKGAQGADIVAQAVVNGVVYTLKREVSVFQGDLTKHVGKALYDEIVSEAAQTEGAQIRQVFIQITDEVMSVSNWRQIVAEKVQIAKDFLGNVTIYVVDGEGRSVLP